MQFVIPNSIGSEIREIGWTDEARVSSLAKRRAHAKDEEGRDSGEGLIFDLAATGRLQAVMAKGTRGAFEGHTDLAAVTSEDRHLAKAAIAKALGPRLWDGVEGSEQAKQLEALETTLWYGYVPGQRPTTMAGKAEAVASHLIGIWAESSGDHQPKAIALQAAAEKLFGLKDTGGAFGAETPDMGLCLSILPAEPLLGSGQRFCAGRREGWK